MELTSLDELFEYELKDMYDAEHQLVDALPKLAESASSPELMGAFNEHLAQTRRHVDRLTSVFTSCGLSPDREKCAAMKGLLTEGKHAMSKNAAMSVHDAALISAAQRVEHYEIAAYSTLRTWAEELGHTQARGLLDETLAEEKAANQKLTEIAMA